MSQKARVRWTVVEQHEALIDVAGIDLDEGDDWVAEHEDNDSYIATTDREITEIDLRPPCPDCGAPLDVTGEREACTSRSCTYST